MPRLPFDQSSDDHLHVSARQRLGVRLLTLAAFILSSSAGILLVILVIPRTPNATPGCSILVLLLTREFAHWFRTKLYRRARQRHERDENAKQGA